MVALVVVAAGCDATPGPTPAPSPSSASRTPSPSPTQRTQQQKDISAAVDVYRKAFAEETRLAAAGGTGQATAMMKQTMTSTYLESILKQLQGIRQNKQRMRGSAHLLGVSPPIWTEAEIRFDGCEDWSATRFYVGSKELPPTTTGKYIQHLIAQRGADGHWRISAQSGTTQVSDLGSRTCSQGFS